MRSALVAAVVLITLAFVWMLGAIPFVDWKLVVLTFLVTVGLGIVTAQDAWA